MKTPAALGKPGVIDSEKIVGSFHRFSGATTEATPACWLVTFVDGLLYRETLFDSIADARRAYDNFGIELGIPAAEPVLPEAV